MTTLATVAVGAKVQIVKVALDEGVREWVAAVGLYPGESVVVLRHAALGGPLHVRTESGGELAVAREIATKVEVAL